MHGERTPLVSSTLAKLTPRGAQQLYDQGAAFRNRYLTDSGHDGSAPIVGLDPRDTNDLHLNVASSTECYAIASANAFLQGLYPPEHAISNGTHHPEFLSCGCEYPNVKILFPCLDQDSIWIDGHTRCNKHDESLSKFEDDREVASFHRDHEALYHSLWDRVFCDTFPRSQANFHNAYDLYDYASFRWDHDHETQSLMTPGELSRLRALASQEQRLKHANVSGSTDADMVHAIAGRTLATKVSKLFTRNIHSYGELDKLNLVFTSHEPFLAFFALAELFDGPSGHLFEQLPYPSATMTFELFSHTHHNKTAYPSVDELQVRFLYRRSADPCARFETYPLFGRTDSCVPFKHFNTSMSFIGIHDAKTWCKVCENNDCFCRKKHNHLLEILLEGGAALLILLLLIILIL